MHRVRMSFAGTFQADVSTVNNDVRHFDNATFQSSYQQPQDPTTGVMNGWWNPTGSGAFRLLDCRITQATLADGSPAPASDPVYALAIAGSPDRSSGKLVDLDPQWQMASAIWGLDVRLTDGHDPQVLAGRFAPNAFRDLWFSRNVNQSGDRAASATFQSVLEGVQWSAAAAASPALSALRAATTGGALSIRLTTFGYQDTSSDPRFTLGYVIGTIGPALPDEPQSFIRGRRFAPVSGFTSWCGLTYCSAQLDGDRVFVDLSNALQSSDATGTPVDIGRLAIGVLRDPEIVENTPLGAAEFEELAEIPYRSKDWLRATGGIGAAMLTPAQLQLAAAHPLALAVRAEVNPGAVGVDGALGIVAIRETSGGLLVGAEPGVMRIDGAASAAAQVYASRYGAPLTGAQVHVAQVGPVEQQGGSGPGPGQPTAPIPTIGIPIDAMTLPATVTTDAHGRAPLAIQTQPKLPSPRGYLDGQLYLIDYRLAGQSNQARQPFDYVVVHVRDPFVAPPAPTWIPDIQPILTQYANLYPIMSQLVNLASPADLQRHASLLKLAFSLELSDPNYMPVTRDLSEPKRKMIVAWLDRLATDTTFPATPPPPPPRAAPKPVDAPAGSKQQFGAGFVGRRHGGAS
ncbi:MAG TPA: hypothetical protein VGM88_33015 [Kofleriaceae bacterium]